MRRLAIGALIMRWLRMRAIGFAPWQQAPRTCRCTAIRSCTCIRTIPKAFTQGLQYVDGVLYEGTGQNGQSSIRKVKLETGKVLQQRDVPAEHFGEGITVWKNDLIELTWQSHVAFVYDRATFEPKKQFTYPGEGWGLTHDGTSLIMSDGTRRAALPGSGDVRREAPHQGHRRRAAAPQSQRARVREGRDLRERLADRLRRAHRARYRARSPATSICAGC